MEAKGKTPEVHTPSVSNVQLNIGNPIVYKGKDTKVFFSSPVQRKIYELFLQGGRYSVVELTTILKISDPRSHIRHIRNAGIPISDYWEKTTFSKYKVYFLHKDGERARK